MTGFPRIDIWDEPSPFQNSQAYEQKNHNWAVLRNYVSSYLKGITDAWEVRWAAQINKTPQPSEIIDARVDVLGHTYPTLKQHLDAIEVNSVEAEIDTQHYGDRTTSWANLKILDLSQNSTSLSYRLIGSVNTSIPQLGYAECFIDDLQTQTA
ncbi:alpha-amylase [Limosilactobacillus reuteri]|uniref:Alpha-amylase n=1 Tax=Limosilactobacillus reuteri TaxID=1598 RepID=A0AB73R7N6_LIMRT|nr:alpha-amylase [Limosilactobacillus reuteri]OYS87798.1 alpha-amylase [Limosilactobacillus reuteri]OYS91208.1 alpha-amylase [Limosilactobacillus reuteri]OYS94413.1 alpha-amylase [Limosilactobacillus reuteri]OYS96269.1 alpha-amylase [Limosilactobacillus reuteri]OYS98174.1 alpha-amylase [Limosilactobacillus reuteri]